MVQSARWSTLRPLSAQVLRLPVWVKDFLWVVLAICVLPNTLVLSVFGHSAELFRGWINIEIGLAFAILLGFPCSRVAAALIAIGAIADLVEPIAHTFYFTPSDALAALRFIRFLPPLRLLLYGTGLFAYIAGMVTGLQLIRQRIGHRRRSALLIVLTILILAAVELCTGRYGGIARMDARSSRAMLIRTPIASMIRQARRPGETHKAQRIESAFQHLSPVEQAAIIKGHMNVVTVLVESWGLMNDAGLRASLAAPLMTPEIASLYSIDAGSVPFVGSTMFGESRELCGEIFDTPLPRILPARLEQCYPVQFAKAGYSTIALHGFNPHMYGRDEWMPKTFQKVIFGPQLKEMGMHTCPGGLVGTCDTDVADFLHHQLATSNTPPKFIHWTTLNSHLPLDVTPDLLRSTNCLGDAAIHDDAVCVWSSLVRRVNKSVAGIASDKSLPPTVFVVVGDHAPPFYAPARRARFSQDRVPFVILTPRISK